MIWFQYIILIVIVAQSLILILVYRNFRFNLNKYQRQRIGYRPKTALCIPCKGIDSSFEKNISSFIQQDYENFILRFVVEDASDPAYEKLCQLKNEIGASSDALDIEILIAGRNESGCCSQKNHNLLYCCSQVIDEVEVIAFADSDIRVRKDWLSHLVYPHRLERNGVSSGYRWFIPKNNTVAELALSALNAKVAQLLGNTRFNQVWGGSMAIRTEVFKKLKVDEIWSKTISDDLSLSYAIKKSGYKVAFVPACLAASYEQMDWKGLFEFGRRQFLITKVSSRWTWMIGFLGSVLSVFGPLVTAGIGIYAVRAGLTYAYIYVLVPFILLLMQFLRAILRQVMLGKMLKDDWEQMKKARLFDILMFWPMSGLFLTLILSSIFGRTIRWRGIRYKLLGPTETVMLD
jgi:cellulose synthase/poly-beta-1,6-N-acetylglucosamine synthase-like glycosyltransferase